MNLTRHDITADDGTRIAVRETGQGDPLLLLHGFPQNHRCWLPVLPALAQSHRCILVDLRGYGDSDAPADEHRYFACGDQLGKILAHDVIRRASRTGWASV